MDECSPFRSKEKWEVRQVANQLFYGGDVTDDVISPLYKKWNYHFQLFLSIIDRRHGNFLHMPTNNSPHEQPFKTMQLMMYLQDLWIEKLKVEAENSIKK